MTRAIPALLLTFAALQPSASYDLLIRNGRVLDGTGNPWFPADVAVKDGRIVAVGRLANAQATTVIDASGKYVTPGFIDIHSHADDGSGPEDGCEIRTVRGGRRRTWCLRASRRWW